MFKVEENKVVTFDYTLTNDSGAVLDTSENSEPLSYIHGSGEIIPGLEAELLGKSVGAKFKATIKPEDAYGLRMDDFVKKTQFVYYGEEQLSQAAKKIEDFAHYEGLQAHANSVRIRRQGGLQ